MVQAKQKKPKLPRKLQTAAKKHGKQADIALFRSQLDDLGLKIIQVTPDGNCFFRALADQLEGNEDEHKKYRTMVVQYIQRHRENFEPFIEDEVPFDEYCKSMGEDGTWAGNMELQAASLVTTSNICIHRSMSPRWYIRNFPTQEVRMVHISYHDGEHYNSVRLREDVGNGPAKPITIKVDSESSLASHLAKSTANKSRSLTGEGYTDMNSTKLVMIGTGCKKLSKVEQVLQEVHGDVDAAIEYLIAEKEMNENVSSDDELSSEKENDTSHGSNDRLKEGSQHMKCGSGMSNTDVGLVHDFSIEHDDKKIPENKSCSCGSRKKHKGSCASSVGKSHTRPGKNNKHNASKGRNERNKKGEGRGLTHGPMVVPDVGALCI